MLSSSGSSQPRDWTQVSHIAGGLCTDRVTRDASAVVLRKMRWYISNYAWIRVQMHEEIVRAPISLTVVTLYSYLGSHPWDQPQEEEKAWTWFQDKTAWYMGGWWLHYSLTWAWASPWMTVVRENLLMGRALGSAPDHPVYVERNDLRLEYAWTQWQRWMAAAGCSSPWKENDWEIGEGEVWGGGTEIDL